MIADRQPRSAPQVDVAAALGAALVDVLGDADLDVLADRLASRVADRLKLDRDLDGYLDSKGAAAFLGCPVSRIHDLTQLGHLRPLRDGRALRFRRSDLRNYIEGQA